MILRPYQREAIDSLYQYYTTKSGNPIMALPTGTGKSVIIAKMCEELCTSFPKYRVVVLTHVKELVEQNYKHFINIWPTAPAGIYSAGMKRKDVYARITFASIQSIYKQGETFSGTDLIIIDEVHRLDDKRTTMYQQFIQSVKKLRPSVKIMGLTATPYRQGMGMLTDGNLFTDICYDLTQPHQFNWLINEGYLSRLVPKCTDTQYNTDMVKITAGEYNLEQLQDVVDHFETNKEVLTEAVKLANGRKRWLVFTTGIAHTEHICTMLNQMGIKATMVHSKMTNDERDANIAGFKSGEYQAIVNNNILTTGFDEPRIDCILVLRPTMSPVLWVQMLGRGTRPVYASGYDLTTAEGRLSAIYYGDKPNCLVLDFAGNTRRLGPINDPVVPRSRKHGQKVSRPAPVVICPGCSTYVHAACTSCPECGTVFPRELRLASLASEDALIKETELPRIELYDVDLVTYAEHNKTGKPPAIKVTYQCGLMFFSEYVCLEHGGYAAKKAREWWTRADTGLYMPQSTYEALQLIHTLKTPKQIHVWVNTKYPQVMSIYYAEDEVTQLTNEEVPF